MDKINAYLKFVYIALFIANNAIFLYLSIRIFLKRKIAAFLFMASSQAILLLFAFFYYLFKCETHLGFPVFPKILIRFFVLNVNIINTASGILSLVGFLMLASYLLKEKQCDLPTSPTQSPQVPPSEPPQQ